MVAVLDAPKWLSRWVHHGFIYRAIFGTDLLRKKMMQIVYDIATYVQITEGDLVELAQEIDELIGTDRESFPRISQLIDVIDDWREGAD